MYPIICGTKYLGVFNIVYLIIYLFYRKILLNLHLNLSQVFSAQWFWSIVFQYFTKDLHVR